jgi:hypothetical protein
MKRFLLAAALAAQLTGASAAVCPISECDYGDVQYKAAWANWTGCINQVGTNFEEYMRRLAILYPRFGIAWSAFEGETKGAIHEDGTIDQSAISAARQRFDDRVLRTAEPEAVQWYNMYLQKMNANPEPCGTMPAPPRKVASQP